jgi:NAD(P)-dependent dehydrogenase (short-subunit alcohol dehydrogenase family)
MELAGRVALITGAGSGIGAATAGLLAQRGAKVGLLSRTAEEVERNAERIQAAGGDALALTADVRDEQAVQAAVQQMVETFGGLDIVIANAGINGAMGPLDELTTQDFDETVGINLKGTFITLKATVPHLKKRGRGVVIVTASINGNGTFNDPGSTIYSATKAAQVAMVKVLALELARDKVRIVAVCPGSIDTEIDENSEKRRIKRAGWEVDFPEGEVPLTGKKPGTPDQVARLMAFLASDDADHITGTEVVIDGGQSLVV